MLPIDPQADRGRRAWVDCPRCRDKHACATCAGDGTCTTHWRYLLSHTGATLHLQCPACGHLWDHDSGFGRR